MKILSLTRETNLTEGNLFKKIPLFALPLALTTVFQLFYTTVDLLTVTHFGGGTLSMTAIGSNSALINLIITVFVSIPIGAGVAIGNAKGANNAEKAKNILHTSLFVGLFSGIAVALFGFFVSRYLLEIMDTPLAILDKATEYLQIYFVGLPFLMIYNYGAQILRSLGDSKRPFFILTISGIVNIAFDFLFVIVFSLDVAGVAWATVLSEAISALLVALWLTFYKKGFVYIHWKEMRIDKIALKEILLIGLPAGIQGLAFSIPNVMIQSSLYTITNYTLNGVTISMNEIISGSSASAQVEGYVFALLDAFSATMVAFVGQNYGARKIKNIRKSFWYCVFWQFAVWAFCALICGFFPKELLSIFMNEGKDVNMNNALLAGQERLYIMVFTYCLDGLMGLCSNYLRGMRHSTAPALITLFGCTGLRILFLYTLFQLPYFHTIFWLYAAFPISWILVNLVYLPVILVTEKKEFASLTKANQSISNL